MTKGSLAGLHPKYRPDIDGLRAIAVLSVILFHAFPQWIMSGFIGVDIFFVISGYLISTIVFSNLEHDSFSIVDFYNRRIRRIFPTLITVMIASLVFGWLVLLAEEYDQLGKHVSAGAAFISNYVLYGESGYFDNAAETKPLLHLWSLAIEEQFYIFWPLLMAFVWKRKWNFLLITAFIAILSFATNIYLIGQNPTAAFYSPISRFWELMIGGMLAYIRLHRPEIIRCHKNIQSVIGFAFIAIGLAIINKEMTFPGWWALLPTVGAFFIISAGSSAWLNKFVLSNKLMVWIGIISYPLYLWHWVLISFLKILAPTAGPKYTIFALFVSIVFSIITYHYIEKPIRTRKSSILTPTILIASTLILFLFVETKFAIFAFFAATVSSVIVYRYIEKSIRTRKNNFLVPTFLVASISILFFSGFILHKKQGLSYRKVVLVNHDLKSGFDGGLKSVTVKKDCATLDDKLLESGVHCIADSREPLRFAIIGDSKAGALAPGLIRTSSDNGRWIMVNGNATNGAPIPVLSNNNIYKRHQPLAGATLKSLARNKNIDVVVIAVATRTLFNLKTDRTIKDLSNSPYYEDAYDGLLRGTKTIIESGKKVILLIDNPTLPYPEQCMERVTSSGTIDKLLSLKKLNKKCVIKVDEHYALSNQYRKLLYSIKDKNPQKIFIFDTIPYLCNMSEGECNSLSGNRFLYGKTDHISDFAAGIIGTALNDFVKSLTTTKDHESVHAYISPGNQTQ